MAAPIVRVDGARELRASMRAAGVNLGDLSAVNKRTAAKVAAAAGTPVPRRSGALASTIRPAGTRTAAIVRAGKASVAYAAVIEFGWPAHHIEPQPYLTTAAHDTEPEWTAYYQDQIDKIVAAIRGEP